VTRNTKEILSMRITHLLAALPAVAALAVAPGPANAATPTS
jgi:hypothetical protein